MVEFWTMWVRDEEQRPHHAKRFAAVREYIGGLIQEKADEMGVTMRLPPDQIGAVVLALADGWRSSTSPTRTPCRRSSTRRCCRS